MFFCGWCYRIEAHIIVHCSLILGYVFIAHALHLRHLCIHRLYTHCLFIHCLHFHRMCIHRLCIHCLCIYRLCIYRLCIHFLCIHCLHLCCPCHYRLRLNIRLFGRIAVIHVHPCSSYLRLSFYVFLCYVHNAAGLILLNTVL